jgi:Winged helix domain, variant/ATPase family associated with various cellular activities (AAA)
MHEPDGETAAVSRGAEGSIADPSLVHLFGRLIVVEARVRAAVERRRATDPDPGDRFRGLYITEAQVDALFDQPPRIDPGPSSEADAAIARVEARADAAEATGSDLRLRRLERSFALDAMDTAILLVALAPDLDPRFERLYAYLHDDVSRRRASAGLALELSGGEDGLRLERHRLAPASRLVARGLVVIDDPDRPFLTRALRVPDRVTAHLLGDDRPEPRVEALLHPGEVPEGVAMGGPTVAAALQSGSRLVYVRDRAGTAGRAWAARGAVQAGLGVLPVDLTRITSGDDAPDLGAACVREALLRGTAIVAGPIEVLADRGPDAVRAFSEAACPVVLIGQRGWDPVWSREVPVVLEAPLFEVDARQAAWLSALGASVALGTSTGVALGAARETGLEVGPEAAIDPVALTAGFRLDPYQVARAAVAARRRAAAESREVGPDDLRAGARAQNAGGLERLARRVEPRAAWGGLVLPPEALAPLRELTSRALYRDRVRAWGVGGGSARGSGVTALFAGDSGTGKTLSAEVVAADLGLDLYVIDLATVVDKYIGETEKNLDRIFSEADRVNGLLLFDEADAIFGKRSEVKDARDRYANVEIAYLLQRMERFDGLAVLTTNLRANLDEAFLRRLDVIVDFPMPGEEYRLRLWDLHLPAAVPRADDLDLPFLAAAFKLSGGNIRNICVAAAFFAAADDRPVTMLDLIRGTEREYQKLGRMLHVEEFGAWLERLEVSG